LKTPARQSQTCSSVLQDAQKGATARRELQQRANDPPILAFGRLPDMRAAPPAAAAAQSAGRAAGGRALRDAGARRPGGDPPVPIDMPGHTFMADRGGLPRNVALTTLKAERNGTVLLRLAHLFQARRAAAPRCRPGRAGVRAGGPSPPEAPWGAFQHGRLCVSIAWRRLRSLFALCHTRPWLLPREARIWLLLPHAHASMCACSRRMSRRESAWERCARRLRARRGARLRARPASRGPRARTRQVGEDAGELAEDAEVDLNALFADLTFDEVEELALSASRPLSEARAPPRAGLTRHRWPVAGLLDM